MDLNFSNQIRRILKERNLSINDLAQLSGLNYTCITNLLRRNKTTTDTLGRIASALKIEAYKLFLPNTPISVLEESMIQLEELLSQVEKQQDLTHKIMNDLEAAQKRIQEQEIIIQYLESKA